MSNKHSQAKKKYWAQFTDEQRRLIMSQRAKKMWSKKSKEERKARSVLMNNTKRLIHSQK